MTTIFLTKEKRFDSAGPEDAPAIVLIHGAVVTRKMWLPQLRGLCDEFHVIAPDLPGHGALANTPFTFESAADVLSDLIQQEARGRALVVGLSLGGYVAMELANLSPHQVAGLVLSGSSLNFQGALAGYLKFVSWLMQRGWLKMKREQAEQKVRRMFPPALADAADAQLQAGVYPGPLGASYAGMAGRDFRAILGRYPGPSLILNGEKDSASRRGENKFASTARQGSVQTILGAGHACNLDQPEKYNQAVRDFARSIGWST